MHIRSLWFSMFVLVSGALTACGAADSPVLQEDSSLASSEAPLLGTVTCLLGTSTLSFSPPLTNTPQDTTVSGSGPLTNCTAVLADPVHSATTRLGPVLRRNLACDSLLNLIGGGLTVTWNTGETSQLALTQVVVSGGTTTRTTQQIGTVVSGKYEGATAVRTLVYVVADVENACASPEGLAQYTSTQTLALTLIP
ncbi:hypothetical protein LXT21_31615 [Myxococcus sp. K38C18041901]|uniref:hypothetical protein n=1 Tax=Myxococcus guangdongensis TaxID=2906760 RepID=UPI0020A722CF|nr:hypothetical protein [Myxococcus guangdongensis]MCP3063337.1 hypothetical protein [Myxococcus guangdongensis]